MSVIYCDYCGYYIDLDIDVDHEDVCAQENDPEPEGDFSGASFDEWGGR